MYRFFINPQLTNYMNVLNVIIVICWHKTLALIHVQLSEIESRSYDFFSVSFLLQSWTTKLSTEGSYTHCS